MTSTSNIPSVSIVLPTYNRAAMLAEGLKSIAAQTFTDWELVIVDDGSTDHNRKVVELFQKSVGQPVTYIYQENKGPGIARQTGLDQTKGEFIAFMDSDDPWLPHHLAESVSALRKNADVDWVVGPTRIIDDVRGIVLEENSFLPSNNPIWLLRLKAEQRDNLWIIEDDDLVRELINRDFPGGVQASVLRRKVIEKVRLLPLRLFDDTAFAIEAFGNRFRLGYFRHVQIVYRVHDSNTSFVQGKPVSVERRIQAYSDAASFCRTLLQASCFTAGERIALRRRLANHLFWNLGYSTYRECGRNEEASKCFKEALNTIGWSDLRMCKTYVLHRIRSIWKQR